jgi:hypothetical protein
MTVEFEQWLFEFKRLYRGYGGAPELTYRTLRHLLELWNKGQTPQWAADQVRLLVQREEAEHASHP